MSVSTLQRSAVRAQASSGPPVELSLVEAVDAIQRLAPGRLSVDIVGVLSAGGSLVVGGWRFEGTGTCSEAGHVDVASAFVLLAVAALLLALVGSFVSQAVESMGGAA